MRTGHLPEGDGVIGGQPHEHEQDALRVPLILGVGGYYRSQATGRQEGGALSGRGYLERV